MSDSKSAGLRGQSAGETSICTVGAEGNSLRYRGYAVDDLAENATFYETAYLVWHGELPNQQQLEELKAASISQRGLPQALCDVLERIPADTHPMAVMRKGCSFL
ncbi:MAG: 2-methylcitrate synthase, partial [Xanthomonadales bacterium]|nr:2-methylcitrate synthase [Xanthomonadales bacterium]